MEPERLWMFGPFRLDTGSARLWRGDHTVALRPRALAVLQYLVAHAGRVVTKTELMQQVWTGTYVDHSVLRGCIREIRAVLGDAATTPQYVETVGGHGYRFVGGRSGHILDPARKGLVVGRQDDIAFLHQRFEQAAEASRQLVFVRGEAGIGKTTLVDLLIASLADGQAGWVGRGQCLEHDCMGEPYLPVLEALGQWGRAPGRAAFLAVLKRYALTWLAQFPALISEGKAERLARDGHGVSPRRMLRELAETLEVLSADTPVVLVLEDLHWSDTATTELLAYLAQRREPARLFILGTYRPEEAVVSNRPLRRMIQELWGRGLCQVLTLERLTAQEVTGYVTGWFNGQVVDTLPDLIYRQTEGQPLFMVNMLAHLVQQGMIAQVESQWAVQASLEAVRASIPEGVRELIVRRIEALPDDVRYVLEMASVAGDIFSAAAVAAVISRPVEAVEAIYEGIVRQGYFIAEAGMASWPDGSMSGRYRFRHVLYRQVLYRQQSEAQRVRLHRLLGERLEARYGNRVHELATDLALHFERGHDLHRAVLYYCLAGEQALRQYAYREAMSYFEHGCMLLDRCPETPERSTQELALLTAMIPVHVVLEGHAAPAIYPLCIRVQELCRQLG